jgi:hypothetical protein
MTAEEMGGRLAYAGRPHHIPCLAPFEATPPQPQQQLHNTTRQTDETATRDGVSKAAAFPSTRSQRRDCDQIIRSIEFGGP